MRTLLTLLIFLLASIASAQDLTFSAVGDEPTIDDVFLVVQYQPGGGTVASAQRIDDVYYSAQKPTNFTFWTQSGGWQEANQPNRTLAYFPATASGIQVKSNVSATRTFLELVNANLSRFNLETVDQRQRAIENLDSAKVYVEAIVQVPSLTAVYNWVVIGLIIAVSIFLVMWGWRYVSI